MIERLAQEWLIINEGFSRLGMTRYAATTMEIVKR